jgi:hypothetical protein
VSAEPNLLDLPGEAVGGEGVDGEVDLLAHAAAGRLSDSSMLASTCIFVRSAAS